MVDEIHACRCVCHALVNESTTHICSCAGRIPTELGLLTNMQSMMLAENKLTGTAPF